MRGAYLVGGELWKSAAADEGEVVCCAHHLDEAYTGVKVYGFRPVSSYEVQQLHRGDKVVVHTPS